MTDLTKLVTDVLAASSKAGGNEQSRVIIEASKVFDDLLAKGYVEAPSYKLAPLDTVPPKSLSGGPTR